MPSDHLRNTRREETPAQKKRKTDMPMPQSLIGQLKLPAIQSPMFLASGMELVTACCRAGVIGTFPALNARTTEGFRARVHTIRAALAERDDAAPFGVNLVVHASNTRLMADLDVICEERVPLVITSLGARPEVVERVQGYGGLVFHDVINRHFAEKAAQAGVDGIIAVCAGAGGHAGTINPFALLAEIRQVFDGCVILGGSLNTGSDVAAARLAGADLAYMGTRFLATQEAEIAPGFKQMIVATGASDIQYTPAISGVAANFMRPSIAQAGLDPDNLPDHGKLDIESEARAWRDVWSAGHGVGGILAVPSATELCARLVSEYHEAIAALSDRDRLDGLAAPV